MHIVLVYNRFRADGGTERMALNTLKALERQRQLRFSVIAREWRGGDWQNVTFHRCRPLALGRGPKLRSFARAACRRVEDLAADLVQSHVHLPCCDVFRADGGAHAEWLVQRRRVLGRWRLRYQAVDRYHRLKLEQESGMYASPRLRAVICNSAMVREDIARHYPEAADKLHVIENAIDTAHFRSPPDRAHHRAALRDQLGIDRERPVFVFVGAGFERKGVATAIRALHHVSGAHLVVIGRESRLSRYRSLARRAGVAQRVHFLGGLGDTRPYLWAADALVHPALYEPFGLVVLEAMAAGLPVIASDKTGAALSLVRSAAHGRVLDALDSRGFADAMNEIAARDEAQREVATTACERAVSGYDLQTMQDRLVPFYESLLGPADTAETL